MLDKINILFEEYKSATNSYDSMQDSLDKAYLAIVFGEIAFFATHINSKIDVLWFNGFSLLYMGFALVLILVSFVLSKNSMEKLINLRGLQIKLLQDESKQPKEEDIVNVTQWEKDIDELNVRIRHVNWHIPIMIFASSILCFLKVCFIEAVQVDTICWLAIGYVIISACMYLHVKRRTSND
jgi:hypothetical protein